MRQDALISAPEPARIKRVARVLIDSSVPHLDRLFDYQVPESMLSTAVAGTRVKVPFGAQQLPGFITEVLEDYASPIKLKTLSKLVSDKVVPHREVYEVAELVAQRYAGTVWDVVRLAVPARGQGRKGRTARGSPHAALSIQISSNITSWVPRRSKPGPTGIRRAR